MVVKQLCTKFYIYNIFNYSIFQITSATNIEIVSYFMRGTLLDIQTLYSLLSQYLQAILEQHARNMRCS